jgi:uncharacterized RDD family membrane protein YckC
VTRPEGTVTPEAVRLRIDVAGLGSRMIAWLLDTLIQLAVLIPLLIGLAAGGPGGTAEVVIILVLVFVIVWLYYPLFEWLWGGRTPGKRAQRIRVVRTDGQPAGFPAIMVRNLIRIVEILLFPFIAVISMLVTRRAQRLGDLAAGTMVIRERSMPAPQALDLGEGDDRRLPGLDTSRLTEREYGLIRSFLSRRETLDPAARAQLARRLVESVQDLVAGGIADVTLDDERLLEAVAQSYRDRFSRREESSRGDLTPPS